MKKNEDVAEFYVEFFDKAIQEKKIVVIIPRSHENAEPRIGKIISVRTSTNVYDEGQIEIIFHVALEGENNMEALIIFYHQSDDIFVYPDFRSAKKEHFMTIMKDLFKKGLSEDSDEIKKIKKEIQDDEEE